MSSSILPTDLNALRNQLQDVKNQLNNKSDFATQKQLACKLAAIQKQISTIQKNPSAAMSSSTGSQKRMPSFTTHPVLPSNLRRPLPQQLSAHPSSQTNGLTGYPQGNYWKPQPLLNGPAPVFGRSFTNVGNSCWFAVLLHLIFSSPQLLAIYRALANAAEDRIKDPLLRILTAYQDGKQLNTPISKELVTEARNALAKLVANSDLERNQHDPHDTLGLLLAGLPHGRLDLDLPQQTTIRTYSEDTTQPSKTVKSDDYSVLEDNKIKETPKDPEYPTILLSLDLCDSSNNFSSLLSHFFHSTKSGNDPVWFCKEKNSTQAYRFIQTSESRSFNKAPSEFLLIPKRFGYQNGAAYKNTTSVDVPLFLTLPNDVIANGKQPDYYRLSSFTKHAGQSADGGHYIQFIRQEDGTGVRWVLFNDDKPTVCSLTSGDGSLEDHRQHAYMYHYTAYTPPSLAELLNRIKTSTNASRLYEDRALLQGCYQQADTFLKAIASLYPSAEKPQTDLEKLLLQLENADPQAPAFKENLNTLATTYPNVANLLKGVIWLYHQMPQESGDHGKRIYETEGYRFLDVKDPWIYQAEGKNLFGQIRLLIKDMTTAQAANQCVAFLKQDRQTVKAAVSALPQPVLNRIAGHIYEIHHAQGKNTDDPTYGENTLKSCSNYPELFEPLLHPLMPIKAAETEAALEAAVKWEGKEGQLKEAFSIASTFRNTLHL